MSTVAAETPGASAHPDGAGIAVPGEPAVAVPGEPAVAVPLTFDDLGTDLHDVTFCVVDLETTGGSPAGGASITEVGAVKVRGGAVLGEFQTLVRPRQPIPAFIAVLTGITDAMVAGAPGIAAVLPAFLEFARGSVLVAHNAPFDVGFLRHAAGELGVPWPRFDILDTARLARRVVTRDDAPDCKLASLAVLFHATTTPDHRALSDARATVDVLHGLIGRLGNLGVQTLEDLQTFSSRVSPAQRRKRHLAEQLPHAPGVYLFRDARGRVLYVGKSRDLRARVRTYFTASETRSRMGEMVGIAESVQGITCRTPLEAEVRELRLIAEHKPRYNRRAKFPERACWVKLTVEPWPRLSVVRRVGGDAEYVGPFGSRRAAEAAVIALQEAFPIRQCTGRLPIRPSRSACALAEMGRCLAPCDGSVSAEDYAAAVGRVRSSLVSSPAAVTEAIRSRMELLAADERFEEAASHRNRMLAFVRGAVRSQRLRGFTSCAEIVGAFLDATGSWEVHVVRHGRLAGAGVIPAGVSARDWVATLRAGADTVVPQPGPTPAATAEESEVLLRWFEQPGVRLVAVDGAWVCPAGGAESQQWLLDDVERSRRSLVPFDEPSVGSTLSRPAR